MSPKEALQKVIEIAGGQIALAKMLKVRQGTISKWLNINKCVPDKYAISVEKVINKQVTRHQLRPDIYPLEDE